MDLKVNGLASGNITRLFKKTETDLHEQIISELIHCYTEKVSGRHTGTV